MTNIKLIHNKNQKLDLYWIKIRIVLNQNKKYTYTQSKSDTYLSKTKNQFEQLQKLGMAAMKTKIQAWNQKKKKLTCNQTKHI